MAGEFEVRAANDMGEASCKANLKVNSELSKPQVHPEWDPMHVKIFALCLSFGLCGGKEGSRIWCQRRNKSRGDVAKLLCVQWKGGISQKHASFSTQITALTVLVNDDSSYVQ